MASDVGGSANPSAAVAEGLTTVMLDMDGTVLDLAYDNYMWLTRMPEAYAEARGISTEAARDTLYGWFRELRGTLNWYCLDHWSERLGIDVVDLHHQHRDRIGYLPGARSFLEAAAGGDFRLLLVTNSHRRTLELKAEVTGLQAYFDHSYSSHDIGHAKEDRRFWEAVREAEGFDPATTLFVDDTPAVLHSASRFGIRHLQHVTRPDTTRPNRADQGFPGIESIAELLQPAR